MRTIAIWLLVCAVGCDGGAPATVCPAALNANPAGPRWTPLADESTAVSARFKVTVDPGSAVLDSPFREPHPEALTIVGGSDDLELRGGAKRFAKHPERIFLELYLVSRATTGLGGVTLTVENQKGASAFYDLSADPWAPPSSESAPTIVVGGIGPEGTSSRIRVAVDATAEPISFDLALSATTTTRISTASSPIQVSADGSEVWAVVPEADALSVIDAKTDQRLARLSISGRPSSVALTADGRLALVACATCNQLVVIDQKERRVTQILGEAEGIGREPRNVVLSPDGSRAWVSAYVGDVVTALDRVGDAFRVAGTVAVGRRPVGMALPPDGRTLLVAHYLPHGPVEDNGGWLSVIGTDTLTEITTAELRDDGNAKEAACLAGVAAFANQPPDALSFEASPTQLAGVFLTPGGAEGWVPALRVAGFPILEGNVAPLGFQFATLGANSPMMLFPLDTRDARAAAFRRVSSVIDFTDRDESFLRCYPALDDVEAVRAQPGANADELQFAGVTIPSQATLLSDSGVARFIGFSRGGRRALVLSYVADELVVLDATTHSPTTRHNLTLSGSNPVGLAVSPDGDKAWVAYENSLFASVLDLSALAQPDALPAPSIVPYRLDPGAPAGQGAAIVTFLMLVRDVAGVPELPPIREIAQVPLVDRDPLDGKLRRGKILFTSSNPDKYPTLTGSREAACAACHPNGGNDGTAWSTMEGERRTLGLWGGVAGRGWLHASGTHRSAVDFATTIVHDRLGGSGLSPADVDALSEYLAHGIPVLQRPRVDAALVARGEALFTRHCLDCHDGKDGGDGNADPHDRFGGGAGDAPPLPDVGTATDWAHVTLGTVYTHLFPPTARQVLDTLRGDRDLGSSDPVQKTLGFTPRPDRPRGHFKASSLVDAWENVVFLHDARFTSLDEVVAYFDQLLGLQLDAEDQRALVEYLKSR